MDNWPDHEEIMGRLCQWLDQTRSECASLDERASDEELPEEPVGFYPLVEQLTALRHDVKLLTKSAVAARRSGRVQVPSGVMNNPRRGTGRPRARARAPSCASMTCVAVGLVPGRRISSVSGRSG